MENIFDRLRFIRHDEIFQTREDAYSYVINHQIRGDYPTITDPSKNRPALFGEPQVLLYESSDNEKGPNVILAIGSVGSGTANNGNRTFFIDTKKTEEEIKELSDKIDDISSLVSVITLDSDTISLKSKDTSDGLVISGDVKLADYKIVGSDVEYNIIKKEGDKGLYAFVDMDYDPINGIIKFNVNGVVKEINFPKDQHIESGFYDPSEESIVFKLADGTNVKVLVSKLIEEWTVLPDGRTINGYEVSGRTVYYTPISFTKVHVGSRETEHEGIYEWQDVLEADVNIADHLSDNILQKDRTGRYLYVKGTADNIAYKDGMTVKDALDGVNTKVSSSSGNLIYKRQDGIYASAMLNYNQAENKLIYTYSDGGSGEIRTVEFKLNSMQLLDDITYDPTKEAIVIRYIDAQGEFKKVEIPVSSIIEEWDVNNVAHNVQLTKFRSEGSGKDLLSADVKLKRNENNILEDVDHELFVNGIADNIKYDENSSGSIKTVIDELSAKVDNISDDIQNEIENREIQINAINKVIGSGFTTDSHETVTYKFEELSDKVENEIERSTEFGNDILALQQEDERLNNKILELSGNTDGKLNDIINNDHSINIDKSNETSPVINVNLSSEIEDGKSNIIKLNNDGLYAGVDLEYYFDTDTGKNLLIFKTTNGTKSFDLKTNSVVDKIYYDPATESIIIEYTVNGKRMPDVVLPIGDLINEWRVYDGHEGAIQLEKTRIASGTSEQDILKASIVISETHDDNILINDNGALYVPGQQIEDNKNAIEELRGEIEHISADIEVENTNTVSMEKSVTSTGVNKLKSNVNISNRNGNIISINNDGIYTQVEYDPNRNILTINGREYEVAGKAQGYEFGNKDADHNVSFTTEELSSGNIKVQADVDVVDCGEY